MQYFHFTETSGRDKREEAFSAKDENELAWFLNNLHFKSEAFAKALDIAKEEKGGGFVQKLDGRFISFEVISRSKYEQVKARKLQNAVAGL